MANPGKPAQQRAPRWQVIDASFELSAPKFADCPAPEGVCEIAVAGRSNVGKSSLLNAFTRHTGLARVSRTPGRTRLLNFFRVRLRGPKQAEVVVRWVDLPGYGFAKAHREVRDAFAPMIEGYLREREALRGLLVLIDARRGPLEGDLELIEYCAALELPCLVCVTKCDKLGASERGLLPRRFAEALGVDPRDVLLTSATSGLGLTLADRGGGLGDELARLARPPEPTTVVPPSTFSPPPHVAPASAPAGESEASDPADASEADG